jgi:peptide/nickel transport system substrate-binding protein
MRRAVLVAILCLGLAAPPALAADLVIGIPSEATSIDPHYQDLTPTTQIREHIFETMILSGPQDELLPGLATAWRITDDPRVWEFTLRRGVRFHDGSPFTARDVVFSIARAPDVPGAPSTFKRYLEGIVEVTAPDDFTLQVHTTKPMPMLPNSLSRIAIVSARLPRDVTPAQFNSGEAAIGTGPYKFVEYVPGSHVKVAVNPDYWGGRQPWDNVTFRLFTAAPSRVAALLAGDVDMIADVPPPDVPRLSTSEKFAIAQGPSNRVIFWALDVYREKTPFITAKDGQAIANPLRDRRVREAISLAVDRRVLVERVMENLAIPASQIPPPSYGGYDAAITTPKADPTRARALLAEAGFPDGFKLAIHSTNNRYPNDANLAQAVAQMLSRIGIETSVTALPVALYFGAARKNEFTMPQIGWGMAPGDAGVVMREALRSDSINNYGKWSNPNFDALLDRADREMDPASRNALLAQASRIAADDVALIVTHYQVNMWAAKKTLKIVPRMDEHTLAMSVTPN